MSEVTHSWKELLYKRGSQLFVGREKVLEHFRLNCLDTVPRDLIIILQGITGVGKSATIARLRAMAREYEFFSVCVDSSIANPISERTVLNLMANIAEQFSSNGIPLTQFDERYYEYKSALQQISEDSTAPARPFDAIGGLHDSDSWYAQAWDTYLHDTFTPNNCTLVRHPVETLTPIFVRDLNTWALVRRILLCFDDWQRLDVTVGAWLRGIMLEGSLSSKIWMVLATRDALTSDWNMFSPVLMVHELVEFSESETRAYLEMLQMTERKRMTDIITFSSGLPVLVKLLSSARGGIAGDLALSTLDRYFKWLSQAQRRAVLLASVARRVDARVLDLVLGEDGSVWFEWLKQVEMLMKTGDVWMYHPALHSRFLTWARREMYEETYAAHVALRAYYLRDESRDRIGSPGESANPALLESIYHGLMINESGALREAILTCVRLLRFDYTMTGEVVETWRQAADYQENPNAVVEWATVMEELWDTVAAGDWQAAVTSCETILKREALDAEVKSAIEKLLSALQARFPQPSFDTALDVVFIDDASPSFTEDDTEQSLVQQDRVLDDTISKQLGEKLEQVGAANLHIEDRETPLSSADHIENAQVYLDSETSSASVAAQQDEQSGGVLSDDSSMYQTVDEWLQRAEELAEKGVYEKALAAYDQVLQLDATRTEVYIERASILAQLNNLPSAIQSYDVVLGVEPGNLVALTNRAWLLMRQGQYMQALRDYDLALSMLPDDVTLLCAKANVHYRLKDYTSALKGYDEAIRRDPAYPEAYLNRGVTHIAIHEYRRAIADFNQVITLDPLNGHAYHRRGRAYAKLQQMALANKDFTRAIELTPESETAYIDLGLLFTKQAEYVKALDVYHQAIALNPENPTPYYNAACAAALMGDVVNACRQLSTAIALHPPYRAMAVKDADFTSIRHTFEFQKCVGTN